MKKWALTLAVLAGICASAQANDGDGGGGGVGGIGTWLWKKNGDAMGATAIITDADGQTGALQHLQQHAFTRVYGSYGNAVLEQRQALAHWNQTLASHGIESQYLMASNHWALPGGQTRLLDKVSTHFIAFQQAVTVEQRFQALHFDIEPHALSEWKQATPEVRRQLLWNLAHALTAVRQLLDRHQLQQVRIYADIPTWYDSSAKIAWADNGSAYFATLAQAIDGVSIMAYERDQADSILNATVFERSLQSEQFRVRLAVDVSDTWPTPEHMNSVISTLQAQGAAVDVHDFTDHYYWLNSQ
ncbi:hypothetical protein CHH28_04265 [Bacterioplanes sanyensis]|uniref:GH26 domain-containing protein n=1 Tax=Bacterioplanes sanyensis TaxID=1249553 RepID=A0A222FGR6_9GAMM|nr:hypothetical protein [Bacterioplanes sanyensis]ASP37939.1 hypothetical protein CHH28_04265 [Bacterioplanes sanyensis]